MSTDDQPEANAGGGDLQILKEFFPEVIGKLKSPFTSHEFILELAHAHQDEYVNALKRYVDGNGDPFQKLHGSISGALRRDSVSIEWLGEVDSEDIFRRPGRCAQWQKRTDSDSEESAGADQPRNP